MLQDTHYAQRPQSMGNRFQTLCILNPRAPAGTWGDRLGRSRNRLLGFGTTQLLRYDVEDFRGWRMDGRMKADVAKVKGQEVHLDHLLR